MNVQAIVDASVTWAITAMQREVIKDDGLVYRLLVWPSVKEHMTDLGRWADDGGYGG